VTEPVDGGREFLDKRRVVEEEGLFVAVKEFVPLGFNSLAFSVVNWNKFEKSSRLVSSTFNPGLLLEGFHS
jgi:hypothetical protein